MPAEQLAKTVRNIKVNVDKCNGCRACEIACSAYHARPKYTSINPALSRIQVVMDPLNDEYVPIRASDYSKAGCDGRRTYIIHDKEYSECSFCGTICPTRDLFKEPDTGLPLKCDMCEEEEIPWCVEACPAGTLVYEEYQETEAIARPDELELGLKSLLDRYGSQKLAATYARLSQKNKK